MARKIARSFCKKQEYLQTQECLAVPARLELATFGLGNRCSIRLSYGTTLF